MKHLSVRYQVGAGNLYEPHSDTYGPGGMAVHDVAQLFEFHGAKFGSFEIHAALSCGAISSQCHDIKDDGGYVDLSGQFHDDMAGVLSG